MTDNFPDDPDDPIPRVGVIDIVSELDNGDLLCGLIIAKPPNKESLRRLVQKVQNYIRELGQLAAARNVRVDFVVHPKTDPAAMQVIQECGVWLEQHSIRFTMTPQEADDLPSLPSRKN